MFDDKKVQYVWKRSVLETRQFLNVCGILRNATLVAFSASRDLFLKNVLTKCNTLIFQEYYSYTVS